MAPDTTRRVLYMVAATLTMLCVVLLASWGRLPLLSSEEGGVTSKAEARALDATANTAPIDAAIDGRNTASPAPLPPLLTSAPPDTTPTVVPPGPLLSSLPGTTPAVATIQPSPGITTVVAIPGSGGNINIPNDAAGGVPLQVVVNAIQPPSVTPTGLTVLSALQIVFTSLTDSSSVKELNQDVTIEISYAGLGLTDEQLATLVIYNATRDTYLPTTIDTARKVAIAKTSRFSTFTLARITGPIPRGYVPLATKSFTPGW